MNLHKADIEVSAVVPSQYPKSGYPEFALAGRSNVGKSSLINKILNRKSLARVSGTPGKTVTINFYNIDDTIYIADLPGYGYAKRSKKDVDAWGEMIETYLETRKSLKQIFLLVDSRHAPTKDDMVMLDWIRTVRRNDPVIVVATKTDKLNKHEFEENIKMLTEKLSLSDEDILIPFSTKDDYGTSMFWDVVGLVLAGAE